MTIEGERKTDTPFKKLCQFPYGQNTLPHPSQFSFNFSSKFIKEIKIIWFQFALKQIKSVILLNVFEDFAECFSSISLAVEFESHLFRLGCVEKNDWLTKGKFGVVDLTKMNL